MTGPPPDGGYPSQPGQPQWPLPAQPYGPAPNPPYGPPPQSYGPMPLYSPIASPYGPPWATVPPPPLPDPPTEVRRASAICYAIAGWQLVGLVISFVTVDDTKDILRENNFGPAAEADVAFFTTIGLVFGTLVALGLGTLYFLCGRKLLQGRHWARVVPTVLIGVGLLGTALALGIGVGSTGQATQVVGTVLGIAFLAYAWRGRANAFFAVARQARR